MPVVESLPKLDSMYRTIQRRKRKATQNMKNPASLQDLNPDEFKQFEHNGDSLYKAHYHGPASQIGPVQVGVTIFAAEANLNVLSQCSILAADATFQVRFLDERS